MKISVITISFNQAIYLRQTIESVVSQRDVDIEYIVVDPGSSDGSREIIQTYKDKLEHIIFEKDSGPGDGLNKGFEKATGDIFCYLNSDDFFEPDVLAWVNNVFAQDPSLGVLYGACNIVDENSSYIRKCFSDRFGLQAAAYGTSIVIQPSTFFRRDLFRAVGGFNVNNRTNWDGELFIDMAMSGAHLKRTSRILSNYRVHGAGITGSGRMHEGHLRHSENMFRKIKGREFCGFDKIIRFCYRFWKHLSHPKALYERLVHGPIFGRGN